MIFLKSPLRDKTWCQQTVEHVTINIWIKPHIQLILTYLFLLHYYKLTWWCQVIVGSLGDFKNDLWNSTFPWLYLKMIAAICWHKQLKLVYSTHDKLYKLYLSLHGGSRGKERKKEQVEMPRAMIQGVLANFSSFDYLISQILREMMGNAILVTNRFRGLKGQIPDMVVGDLTILRKIIKLPGKGNTIHVGITLPTL